MKNPTGKLTGVVRRRMPDPDGLFTGTHAEVFEPEGATVPGVPGPLSAALVQRARTVCANREKNKELGLPDPIRKAQ